MPYLLNVTKKFDIKPFVIDLTFGFWHLTFEVRNLIAVPVIEL